MSGRQLALLHQRLHGFRQLQQTQHVGEMTATLADHFRQALLCVLKPLDQIAIATRLFERIEIGALDILDQRDLEMLLIGQIAHDDGQRMHAGPLRRPPAPLARHDLVARLPIGH